ncbi:hypothetical protein KAH94_04680 [bacterium]|nr:hypothetical protein [bacterium]
MFKKLITLSLITALFAGQSFTVEAGKKEIRDDRKLKLEQQRIKKQNNRKQQRNKRKQETLLKKQQRENDPERIKRNQGRRKRFLKRVLIYGTAYAATATTAIVLLKKKILPTKLRYAFAAIGFGWITVPTIKKIFSKE